MQVYEKGCINRTNKKNDQSDCNGTRTHNHLVRKRTLNHLTKSVP